MRSILAPLALLGVMGLHGGGRLALTGLQLLGIYGQLSPGSPWAPLKGRLERAYLASVAATIAAGTSEIQRSIVAQRGMELPRG